MPAQADVARLHPRPPLAQLGKLLLLQAAGALAGAAVLGHQGFNLTARGIAVASGGLQLIQGRAQPQPVGQHQCHRRRRTQHQQSLTRCALIKAALQGPAAAGQVQPLQPGLGRGHGAGGRWLGGCAGCHGAAADDPAGRESKANSV